MLLVPLHFILFIRFCLLYLDPVISMVWKRALVQVPTRTMTKCHEATGRYTSGDTATDRNPLS